MIEKSKMIRGLVVVGPLFALGIFFLVRDQNRKLTEYPLLTMGDSIEGRVVDIEVARSICRVQLSNKRKNTIPFARNYKYSPSDLNKFLREGDEIRKMPGSDTVIIRRDHENFLFRLDKVLGNEMGLSIAEPIFDTEFEKIQKAYKEKYN